MEKIENVGKVNGYHIDCSDKEKTESDDAVSADGQKIQNGKKKSSVWMTARNKLKLTQDGATPVNWKMIGLIFISLFSSSFSLTFLFPFLPEMILFFGYQEAEKGYYAGLVASGVFAGRALGSYFWGWLSDKLGRRPVMLMTIFGNGLFCVIFGFTINLPMAIATRFLSGVANGSVGIAKTVLYEISDDTNQAVGMSILAMSWGAGVILGPTMGGLLADPARRYPEVFDKDGVFGQFPYLLPGLIVGGACFLILIVDFFLLPETMASKIKEIEINIEESKEELEQLAPTESSNHDNTAISRKISMSVEDLHCETERALYQVKLEYRSCQDISNLKSHESHSPNTRKRTSSYTKDKEFLETGQSNNQVSIILDETVSKKRKSFMDKIRDTSLVKICSMPDCREAVFLYTIFSFGAIGFEEIFTVWASTEQHYDGLGFSADKIGMVLGITAVPMLFLNLFIFPLLNRYLGSKKTFIVSCFLDGWLVTIVSMLHLIHSNETTLWVILLVLIIPQKIMTSCCFTATSLFVNNSSPPHLTGAVNGISMTTTAIARTIAPTVGGSIYAWSIGNGIGPPFDVNFVFFIFGILFWGTGIYSIFMNESLNKQKK